MAVYQVGYQVKEKYQLMEAYKHDFGGGGHQADVGPGTDPGFGRRSAGCSPPAGPVGHHSMNRDRGRDGGRSSSSWDSRMEACLCCPGSRGLRQSTRFLKGGEGGEQTVPLCAGRSAGT